MQQFLGFDPAQRSFDPFLFLGITNIKPEEKNVVSEKQSPPPPTPTPAVSELPTGMPSEAIQFTKNSYDPCLRAGNTNTRTTTGFHSNYRTSSYFPTCTKIFLKKNPIDHRSLMYGEKEER